MNSFFLLSVVLRANVQQLIVDIRVQEQRRVCHQQEEPNGVQGVSVTKMPAGRNVEKWIALRPPLELVQDPLSAAGAAEQSQQQHHHSKWQQRRQQQQLAEPGAAPPGQRDAPERLHLVALPRQPVQ